MGSLISHDGWEECDQQTNEIAKERLKDTLKKAAEEAANQGWGSVTQDVRKDIMDRIQTKVDWRKMLRYFIKTSQKANKQSSMKSINKRYPYIHAGKKTSRTAKIAISIDQSGSVSDAMLNAFFSELSSKQVRRVHSHPFSMTKYSRRRSTSGRRSEKKKVGACSYRGHQLRCTN